MAAHEAACERHKSEEAEGLRAPISLAAVLRQPRSRSTIPNGQDCGFLMPSILAKFPTQHQRPFFFSLRRSVRQRARAGGLLAAPPTTSHQRIATFRAPEPRASDLETQATGNTVLRASDCFPRHGMARACVCVCACVCMVRTCVSVPTNIHVDDAASFVSRIVSCCERTAPTIQHGRCCLAGSTATGLSLCSVLYHFALSETNPEPPVAQ